MRITCKLKVNWNVPELIAAFGHAVTIDIPDKEYVFDDEDTEQYNASSMMHDVLVARAEDIIYDMLLIYTTCLTVQQFDILSVRDQVFIVPGNDNYLNKLTLFNMRWV